ncbi:AI-2E family transporter [Acidipila rosea]|uniref:Putative PurR-regulated permease PerM n=1 Tax=Acidipila rosea TaxID=768535 RepID=A0A4R1L402_9BACT|nr:AI-2E family transporter [Acidipila rosea]TCK72782.1 putative PurR-regulated permease PerM [Acidipila rosea]
MDTNHPKFAADEHGWKDLTFFLLTIAAVLLCAIMLNPFVPAVIGAIVLAIVTQRPHGWVTGRVRNRTLAASISVIVVSLIIIVPSFFLGQVIGRHVLAGVHNLQSGGAEQGLRDYLNRSPRTATALQYSLDNINPSQALERAAGFVAGKIGVVVGGSISALTQIILMLFILFFLYRDKQQGLGLLHSLLPLHENEIEYLLARITDTVNAIVTGRFLVAGAQGLVAGIAFASLGIGGAALLGFITALFAMIPSFGAFLVWLPVALYLAAIHHWLQAIIMAVVGSLIISTLDNFLYPVLVGTRLRIHTVPVFLSILGGIWLFGIAGLILGPIIFTVAESFLVIWRRRMET